MIARDQLDDALGAVVGLGGAHALAAAGGGVGAAPLAGVAVVDAQDVAVADALHLGGVGERLGDVGVVLGVEDGVGRRRPGPAGEQQREQQAAGDQARRLTCPSPVRRRGCRRPVRRCRPAPEADDVREPPVVAAVLVVEVDGRPALGAGRHRDDVVGVAQEGAARVDEPLGGLPRAADVGCGPGDGVGRAQDVAVAVLLHDVVGAQDVRRAPTRAGVSATMPAMPATTSTQGQDVEPAPAHGAASSDERVRTTSPRLG